MLHLPGGFPPISNRGIATDSKPDYPFCTHCKEQYDPAWAMRAVDPQLPTPYTSVACSKCAQVNRATGRLIGLERPYVFCRQCPARVARIDGPYCPGHR